MKYLLPLLMFMMISCAQQQKTSTKGNPIEDIIWIKEFINETKKSPFPSKVIITQYKFKGEIVYLVNHCYQCADEMSILYNIKKEKLSTFGGMIANENKHPNFFKEATEKKELWRSF